MKVHIAYQAQYAYEETVTFSPHLFRLFPKAGRHLRVRNIQFQTNPDAVVHYRRDIFDNEIASSFYPAPSAMLATNLVMDLEIDEWNAFGFLLDTHATEILFAYHPSEMWTLQPYLRGGTGPEMPFWKPPQKSRPTIELLVELNDAIHKNLEYERRDEGAARPAAETLRLQRGACRDFAILLMDALRGLGLAARLASGYLCEFGNAKKIAEGALHAWVEVYLPGAGWLGMDPTNGTLCDHHHITAAVGLTPDDISPVHGRYFHTKGVPHRMNAALQIHPHE